MRKLKLAACAAVLAFTALCAADAHGYCVYYVGFSAGQFGIPEAHFYQQCSYGSGWLNAVQLW